MEKETTTPQTQNSGNPQESAEVSTVIPIAVSDSVRKSDMRGGYQMKSDRPESEQAGNASKSEPGKVNADATPKVGPDGQPLKPEAGAETKTELDPFSKSVIEALTGMKLNEEGQKQFTTDLQNWDKFTKSNTEKAMALSDRERMIGDIENALNFSKIVNMDENKKLIEALGNEDLLAFVDSFVDKPEDNPVRQFLAKVQTVAPEVVKYTEAEKARIEKEKEIEIREEVLGLQALKDSMFDYSNDDQVIETSKIADQLNIDLKTAHVVRTGMESTKVINELKTTKKAVEDELLRVKAELEDLKKKTPSGQNPKSQETNPERYEEVTIPSRIDRKRSWDAAVQRAHEKLGII